MTRRPLKSQKSTASSIRSASRAPRQSERRAQLGLEQLHELGFPANVVVGNVEHDHFFRVRIAKALADKTPMRSLPSRR